MLVPAAPRRRCGTPPRSSARRAHEPARAGTRPADRGPRRQRERVLRRAACSGRWPAGSPRSRRRPGRRATRARSARRSRCAWPAPPGVTARAPAIARYRPSLSPMSTSPACSVAPTSCDDLAEERLDLASDPSSSRLRPCDPPVPGYSPIRWLRVGVCGCASGPPSGSEEAGGGHPSQNRRARPSRCCSINALTRSAWVTGPMWPTPSTRRPSRAAASSPAAGRPSARTRASGLPTAESGHVQPTRARPAGWAPRTPRATRSLKPPSRRRSRPAAAPASRPTCRRPSSNPRSGRPDAVQVAAVDRGGGVGPAPPDLPRGGSLGIVGHQQREQHRLEHGQRGDPVRMHEGDLQRHRGSVGVADQWKRRSGWRPGRARAAPPRRRA